MQPVNRDFLIGALAAGALSLSLANVEAAADDFVQHLRPVGPHEPILTKVGNKRVIAFYEPDGGRCAVHAVGLGKNGRRSRHDLGGARSGQA